MKDNETKTIELTRDQYRNLLRLTFMGEWVMHAHGSFVDQELEATEEHLYSYASDFESNDWALYDEKLGKYFPTRDMEDEVMVFIDEYDNDTFWTELIRKMSDRDFNNAYKNKIDVMTMEERFEALFPYEEKYEKQFAGHGIDNLILKPSLKEDGTTNEKS